MNLPNFGQYLIIKISVGNLRFIFMYVGKVVLVPSKSDHFKLR